MKAMICTSYGAPEVLQLKTVEKPIPQDNEVLIRVYAALVTSADCSFRKGDPFIVKLIYGLRRPKFPTLGVELAGEVEAVGKAVTLFKQGDQVFGMSPKNFGAYAEYKCLPEDGMLVIKSPGMTYEDAAGIIEASTALMFLRDTAAVRSGQKVLINGASGGVGTYAVQLAKSFGAEVTAVCRTANHDLVTALGADAVIDYTQVDFTKTGQTYDVIFDAVGKSSFGRCKAALTPQGIYLSTVPTLAIMLQMLWTSKIGRKKAKFVPTGLMQTKTKLLALNELFEAGTLRSVIDRRYSLEQLAEAHGYVDQGHKKGNVVITV